MLPKSLSSIYLRCLKQTKYKFQRCSFQQLRFIYSATKEWDEHIPHPAVLREVEKHWLSVFQNAKKKEKIGKVQPSLGKKYVLPMFPYPSGNLHMGHVRIYTLSDALSRFYQALGHEVIHPVGWDAFGLPAENAAIERGISPSNWTQQNIQQMQQQFQSLGYKFDWERELCTCDPEYYAWTQHLFLRLFKAKLTYRKQAFVNWDPVDQTVLADEQVDAEGRAWRSGAAVERKLLHQWYIQCSRFSKALYDGLDSGELQDWGRVVAAQREWIGRCDGYIVMMELDRPPGEHLAQSRSAQMPVYMRQPELLHGLTFLGVRSDHELAVDCSTHSDARRVQYEKQSESSESPRREQCEFRLCKTRLVNPLTGAHIPIIVSDALPFSPSRAEFYCGFGAATHLDSKISEACDWPIIDVLQGCTQKYINEQNAALLDNEMNSCNRGRSASSNFPPSETRTNKSDPLSQQSTAPQTPENESKTQSERGAETSTATQQLPYDPCLENSGVLSGLACSAARAEVLRRLHQRQAGGFMASPHLKDWLISRQRSWGAPIPVVHCSSCGCVPVPEADLPVLLPCHQPGASHAAFSDLRSNDAFKSCLCPQCGGAAERETDTMDTFVDSSWYFLRFLDPHNRHRIFESRLADQGMPVDLYIGGEEHAVLHLYYARFMQHFLHSEGLTCHTEPFSRLLLVGRIKAPAYRRRSDGKYLRPEEVDVTTHPPTERATGEPLQVSLEKMSKSKHNGVEPSAVLAEFSIDLTRLAVLRGEAPSSNCNWDQQKSMAPVLKWVLLIWKTVGKFVELRQEKVSMPANVAEAEDFLRTERNVTVLTVTRAFEASQLHSAIRRLETFGRHIRSAPMETIHGEEYERCLGCLLQMLAPLVPHVASELWEAFSDNASLEQYQESSVLDLPWPQPDPGFQPPFRVFVEVNDKDVFKGVLETTEALESGPEELLRHLTQQHKAVAEALEGRAPLRTTLDVSQDGFKAKLAVYTLTSVELRRLKKERSRQKKALLAQKLEENSNR